MDTPDTKIEMYGIGSRWRCNIECGSAEGLKVVLDWISKSPMLMTSVTIKDEHIHYVESLELGATGIPIRTVSKEATNA